MWMLSRLMLVPPTLIAPFEAVWLSAADWFNPRFEVRDPS
jgi:hypothetical protein